MSAERSINPKQEPDFSAARSLSSRIRKATSITLNVTKKFSPVIQWPIIGAATAKGFDLLNSGFRISPQDTIGGVNINSLERVGVFLAPIITFGVLMDRIYHPKSKNNPSQQPETQN